MKRVTATALGAVFAAFAVLGIAQAADKFGYVDLSRSFSEYYKTKDYEKVLNSKEDAAKSEVEKKAAEIKQLDNKFKLMSDKEKEANKAQFVSKAEAFQEFQKQKVIDLRKEQDVKMQEILKDIEAAVKTIAQKEGYTMIFNDRVLVYQDKANDITDKVIAIINGGKVSPAAPAKK